MAKSFLSLTRGFFVRFNRLTKIAPGVLSCAVFFIANISYAATPQVSNVSVSAATSVTKTTATLNGSIINYGALTPTVTVYWGTTDGGQVVGNWTNSSAPTSPAQPQGSGAFYKDITDLSENTTYYFSAKVVDSSGTGWPSASLQFTTESTPIPVVETPRLGGHRRDISLLLETAPVVETPPAQPIQQTEQIPLTQETNISETHRVQLSGLLNALNSLVLKLIVNLRNVR